ncbi:hypothetical protein F4810DRAFT_701381 [Camillea tinctor]|nr:hypothetical protein F4810DRAFT_701381 [Camillea tinctor]
MTSSISGKPIYRSSQKTRRSYTTIDSIIYHVYTAYLFSCNNIKDIICLGFSFGALNASIAPGFSMGPSRSLTEIIQSTPAMFLWSWANLFLFNLHNQRYPAAIAEDALNKPWRPLPAGRLTPRQATRVMYYMYPVMLIISLAVGGLVPSLAEALSCLWYNEWGSAANPFVKNLLNKVGFACFFARPLEVVTGHSIFSGKGVAAIWLLILAAAITTTSHLQDFRDTVGDKLAGRKTVPLVLSDTNARAVAAFGVIGWTYIACPFWETSRIVGAWPWLAGTMMAGNLFRDRSIKGDILTWKMFPLWFMGLFILPFGNKQVWDL